MISLNHTERGFNWSPAGNPVENDRPSLLCLCILGCIQQLLGFIMLHFLVLPTETHKHLNHILNQWPRYYQLSVLESLHLWTLLTLCAASELGKNNRRLSCSHIRRSPTTVHCRTKVLHVPQKHCHI